MHRPTRQHRNLLAKLARKATRTRKGGPKDGPKAKRMKKWAEAYKALNENAGDEA